MRLGAWVAAAVMALGSTVALAPPSSADLDFALNGNFRAFSNGDWAKTNEVFMDEVPKTQIWTITSTCTTAHDCSGEMSSDAGWAAPIRYHINAWFIDREIPNWQPCPDGTLSPGNQRMTFQGIDLNGQNVKNNTRLAGYERTMGLGGACGRNQPLVIQMPLTVEKL